MTVRRILLVALSVALLAACAKPADRAAAYIKNAQALYDKGDYKKANIEARNAAQIDPKNVQARYLMALIGEKMNDGKEMFGNLSVVVELDPKFLPAQVKLGTMLFGARMYDEAAKHAQAATALAPDDPTVRVLNARLLFQKGDLAAGSREIDAALAKQPDLTDAVMLKAAALSDNSPEESLKYLRAAIAKLAGDDQKPLRKLEIAILQKQKRMDDATAAVAALSHDYPKDAEIQIGAARFLASQGKLDDAERILRASVAQDPANVEARLTLVQFLAQLRSLDVAQKALEEFVAKSPDSPELRLALGRIYEAGGKREEALKAYQPLADKNPKSQEGVNARVRIGVINLLLNKKDAGRKMIEDVIKDVSDEPEALLVRGGWRIGDRKYDDAIGDFRTVLRKEPNNRIGMLFLARTYAVSGQMPLAKDAYRQLLTKDPGNADAAKELAVVEARGGNTAAAEEILRKRLEVDAKDTAAKAMVVDLLLRKNDFVSAEATARELASGTDEKGTGEFQLARALQAQKKFPQAIEAYKRVLEKNPQLNLAIEGLASTYLQMGKNDDAIAVVDGAVRQHPDDYALKFLLAGTYIAAGRIPDAVKTFEVLTAGKPEVAQFWISWATLYAKEPARRLEILRKGSAAAPKSEELALLVGSQLEAEGRFDEAISHYDKALAANAVMDVVANNFASLLVDRRTDKASYARALEITKRFDKSTVPNFLDTLGWAYYRTGDFANAATYVERALARVDQVVAGLPSSGTTQQREAIARDAAVMHYHLGMAYVAGKNNSGARKELTKAAADPKNKYPGSEEARATLQKLGPG